MKVALCAYPGGKRSLLKYLLPLVGPHHCYVEVFSGAAALFFNKPRSPVEVINDINSDLVNAFRCLRAHPRALMETMSLRLNSREELRGRQVENLTDIQKAANFLIFQAISFGADGKSFGVTRKNGGGASSSIAMLQDALLRLSERLDGVIVENLPWERCVDLYDGKESFLFFDPPYIGTQQGAYKSWDLKTFSSLVERLRRLEGQWLLTINDLPEVRYCLEGFNLRPVSRSRGIKTGKMSELIVTSKP